METQMKVWGGDLTDGDIEDNEEEECNEDFSWRKFDSFQNLCT